MIGDRDLVEVQLDVGDAALAGVAIAHDRAFGGVAARSRSALVDRRLHGVRVRRAEVVPQLVGHDDEIPVVRVVVFERVGKEPVEVRREPVRRAARAQPGQKRDAAGVEQLAAGEEVRQVALDLVHVPGPEAGEIEQLLERVRRAPRIAVVLPQPKEAHRERNPDVLNEDLRHGRDERYRVCSRGVRITTEKLRELIVGLDRDLGLGVAPAADGDGLRR